MNDFKLTKIVHDKSAYYGFMKSDPVSGMLGSLARGIAQDAGNGYEPSVWQGDTRAVGNVRAESFRAMRDNSRNQTLIRALMRRAR